MLYWETAHTVAINHSSCSTLRRSGTARTRIDREFDPGAVRRLKA
jgi:hypothetical protein